MRDEPFMNWAQARLAPKPHIFELQCMREHSRKCASLRITHNNQTTYQTIHFKHNNNITWTRTVLEMILVRCDQLTGPHGSCQILHCWYTSEPPSNPVSQKSEE